MPDFQEATLQKALKKAFTAVDTCAEDLRRKELDYKDKVSGLRGVLSSRWDGVIDDLLKRPQGCYITDFAHDLPGAKLSISELVSRCVKNECDWVENISREIYRSQNSLKFNFQNSAFHDLIRITGLRVLAKEMGINNQVDARLSSGKEFAKGLPVGVSIIGP